MSQTCGVCSAVLNHGTELELGVCARCRYPKEKAPMRYAWAYGSDFKELSERVDAENAQGQHAICPLHGCSVVSRNVNGVWQWVHENGRKSEMTPLYRKEFEAAALRRSRLTSDEKSRH